MWEVPLYFNGGAFRFETFFSFDVSVDPTEAAARECWNPQLKNDMRLQVSILHAVGAIARPEQASHEVGSPYLDSLCVGTLRFKK